LAVRTANGFGTDTAPSITLVAPTDPVQVHVSLTGTVSDTEQTAETLIVEVTSDVQGRLIQLYPDADGSWSWSGDLQTGSHHLTATVRDTQGKSSSAEAVVEVTSQDHAPTCQIDSPKDGATYPSGSTEHFAGSASDEDGDEVRLLWSSNVSGGIFEGTEYDYRLPDGQHTITVTGDDLNGGTCTDSVQITVGS